MPNYTTNLGLEKPLDDEQYNIDVFNSNADKIDQFAGQVPARALTADKLTTGAKINGVNFKGDSDITLPTVNTSGNQTIGGVKTFSEIIQGNIANAQNATNDGNGDKIDETYIKTADLADKWHALKGYSDEGEVLTDAEGLTDVINYAHSTFDVSKFTVVGTPTITDGVVTSPTNSNYLYTTLSAGTLYNDLEINFNYVFNASGYICQHTNIGNSYMIYNSATATELTLIYSNQGGAAKNVAVTINNFSFTAGIEYNVNIHVSGQSVRYKVTNLSNGTTKYADGSLDNSYYVSTGFTKYFVLYNVQSADYKKTWIKVDGVPIFSGNKTGIDTIKSDDYTVAGSPTISDDGIVSGFSSSNSVVVPKSVIDSLIGHTWEIEIPVENIPAGTAGACALGKVDYGNYNIILGRANTGTGLFAYFINGTTPINSEMYVTLNATDKGTCFVGFDGTKYYIKLVLSTGTVRTANYSSTTAITAKANGMNLYHRCEGCSLDLNKVKIRRDGNLVYQPCLKIPYTEGFNGEKIANVVYRGRVQDAYNQGFTNALYFTLDEENGNFTLPMGELYGMITRNQQEIGLPVPTLSNNLKSNEIWLEGASVLKSVYPQLYAIYGDDYEDAENPTDSDHFRLPNCVGRIMQGIDSTGTFGYLAAGLPNITGAVALTGVEGVAASGAFAVGDSGYGRNIGHEQDTKTNQFTLDASRSSVIYGNSNTVQPPAIKVRVKTRFK